MKPISKPMAGAHSDHMEVVGVTVHNGKSVTRMKENVFFFCVKVERNVCSIIKSYGSAAEI